jgi:ABC-type iron transport system FetAB ATPase subunit
MPTLDILREVPYLRTPRSQKVEAIFDLPVYEKLRHSWHVDLPIDDFEWSIGVIVGPSGCGKSTIARELFGEKIVEDFVWSEKSIVDNFPESMAVKEITQILSSVGFSSPPSWLKPFSVLSNGERFRATLARAVAECKDFFVFDEYTGTVDRTVAKIGSAAIQKTIRAQGKKFVAVTCHYDVLEWLEPDWIYDPSKDDFSRVRLRRPGIECKIHKVPVSWWSMFVNHHYLTGRIHQSSQCFVGFIEGVPVAFVAIIQFPHPLVPAWKIHRVVVLPDFQGIGIGVKMTDEIAKKFKREKKKRVTLTAAHPGLIFSLSRSKRWKMISSPRERKTRLSKRSTLDRNSKNLAVTGRPTASFEFVGDRDV